MDLEILDGECFALLGPNGAGKTTTTEILEVSPPGLPVTSESSGVDPQTSPREWRARLGIVQTSQGQAIPGSRESLEHFAGYYPNPRSVQEVIVAVGPTKDEARTANLSGGQRRLDVASGSSTTRRTVPRQPTTGSIRGSAPVLGS